MSTLHLVLGIGALGLSTGRAFLSRWQAVRLVNRSGTVRDLPPGAVIVGADTAAMRCAADEAAATHYCVQPPYHLRPSEFPGLQDRAIALTAEVGSRLVVAENLYGYGPVEGPMTEETPLRATTRKGATRAAMHRTLRAGHVAGRIEMAVARGLDFFGPGVTQAALGAAVFDAILAGRRPRVIGNPDLTHSYAFVPDFGTAMEDLGTDPRAAGQVFHVPNAPATTTRAMIAEAAALTGRDVRPGVVAPWQVRLLSLAVPPLREMVELTYQATRPFVVGHAKFVGLFGDISTPRAEALALTLASLRPAVSQARQP